MPEEVVEGDEALAVGPFAFGRSALRQACARVRPPTPPTSTPGFATRTRFGRGRANRWASSGSKFAHAARTVGATMHPTIRRATTTSFVPVHR